MRLELSKLTLGNSVVAWDVEGTFAVIGIKLPEHAANGIEVMGFDIWLVDLGSQLTYELF